MSPFGPEDLDAAEARKNGGKPRARGTLPHLPAGGEIAELEAWLTAAFRPPGGYRLDLFERAGSQRTDPCSITFRNGRDHRTFRFNRQADLMSSGLRSAVLGISDGWLRMGHLTGSETEDVWAGLCIYGRVMTEFDDRDETRKWLEMLLDDTEPLRGHSLMPDRRHDALMAMRARGQFMRADALAFVRAGDAERVGLRRPVRFVDVETEQQYVRSQEIASYIRHVAGADPLPHTTLRARLHEIGVQRRYFEDYRPPHPKTTLYELTETLVEYAESTPK